MEFLLLVFLTSLVATDTCQTEHWIEGTIDSPIKLGDGYYYEVNTFLAGKPERREPYFDFLSTVIYLIPEYTPPPVTSILLAGLSAYWFDVVSNNYNNLRRERGERFARLQFRLSF